MPPTKDYTALIFCFVFNPELTHSKPGVVKSALDLSNFATLAEEMK